MAEPISTTAAGATGASMGVMALLAGWLGVLGADVVMVLMASIAGGYIAITYEDAHEPWLKSVGHLMVGVILSFTLAWALAGVVAKIYPDAQGPYLPSGISLLLGVLSRRIGRIVNGAADVGERRLGIKEGDSK